jgi:predicted small metal-binding protein
MPTAPTYYVRCSYFLSLAVDENGQPCQYMVKAPTEDAVMKEISQHIQKSHKQDPKTLQNTIKFCIRKAGTKTYGTRAPGGHH